MSQRLPPAAYALGLGGVVPFVACGIAAASPGTSPPIGLAALVAYAAIILSFVGAVHWGFALQRNDGSVAPKVGKRLLLGVLPSLAGWAAMLLQLSGLADLALALLIASFIAVPVVEARGAALDLLPAGYMALRWGLTVLVVMTLTTVLVLRLLGASLTF